MATQAFVGSFVGLDSGVGLGVVVIIVVAVLVAALLTLVVTVAFARFVASTVSTASKRRAALEAQLAAEGIVLDTGWVRMTSSRTWRRTNAPDRLVLTSLRLQLVAAHSETRNVDFGRLRVWHTGDILQIEIATDDRNPLVQVDAIWVKVAEPSRWVSELGSRGAIVAPIHDTG